MATPTAETIRLEMAGPMKLLYGVVVVMSIGFVLSAFPPLSAAFAGSDWKSALGLLTGIAFFGGGAVMIVRLMRKKAGYLCIRPDGLVVDTYVSSGTIPWSNLEAARVVRVMGLRCLGLAVRDRAAYLGITPGPDKLIHAREQRRTQGFLGFMMAVAPKALVNALLGLLGYDAMPASARPADMLEWNRNNTGYDVLIQSFWLRSPNELAERIASHITSLPVAGDGEARAAAAAEAVPAGFKRCPMCAELVRERALLCRFCRFEFKPPPASPAPSGI